MKIELKENIINYDEFMKCTYEPYLLLEVEYSTNIKYCANMVIIQDMLTVYRKITLESYSYHKLNDFLNGKLSDFLVHISANNYFFKSNLNNISSSVFLHITSTNELTYPSTFYVSLRCKNNPEDISKNHDYIDYLKNQLEFIINNYLL